MKVLPHLQNGLQNSCHSTPTQLNNLLSVTVHTKNIRHACQIHAQVIANGYSLIPFLFNNLLHCYGKGGRTDCSLLLFSSTRDQSKNIVSWTSLIAQLSHKNKHLKALTSFNQMRQSGVFPNEFTFSAILPACAGTMAVFHGELMHCLVVKDGFSDDVFVGSSLVDMYAKCCAVDSARKAFGEMPVRNLVTWNSRIVGFLQNKCYNEAVKTIKEVLQESAVIPDEVTFSSSLTATAGMRSLDMGMQLHGTIIKYNASTLPYIKNSLMDMYSKCGSFEDAAKLFRILRCRDIVTWNVMMMGCVHNKYFEEAFRYFGLLINEGISPDEASLSTALHASSCLSAMTQGVSIHAQIIKYGLVNNNCIGSSLITMYSKCGSLSDACLIFEEIEDCNVVCWSAMIASFQQHGCADKVMELFENMTEKGIKPDHVTLVSLLSACSHSGLVDKGFKYFNSMIELYSVVPGQEHYACMVDMLGRAGRLDEAKQLTESMPMNPDSTVWGALLGACRNHGNLEMGKKVAEKLFELEPNNSGNYILLSNMYSRSGRLKEADEVRRLMGMNGVRKETGCSWIDVKNTTFVFTAHDRMTSEIYEVLGELEESVKRRGYVGEAEYAVNSMGAEKERSLWYHSEKLALAFGLVNLPKGATIRIKKNLRTCGDCHTVMKFASEIYQREILVRDINRFHRFVGGQCSCGDYW